MIVFDRDLNAPLFAKLAQQNIYLGTSSWKYPGWIGALYSKERYLTRGSFSQPKFERTALGEYAEVFCSVCVDASYYTFPSERFLTSLADQVPHHFRFAFKATDTITLCHFPNLPRFGPRAGRRNPDFLNPELFAQAFLQPLSSLGPKCGLIILEFSRFYERDFKQGRQFVAALDLFLGAIPHSFPIAVEIRNGNFLQPDYFAMLRQHRVAHCLNQWTQMPDIGEQLALRGSLTTDFIAARFLLSDQRTYKEAVGEFEPYDRTVKVHTASRSVGQTLIQTARSVGQRPSYLFVNNRLEGNALNTLAAFVQGS